MGMVSEPMMARIGMAVLDIDSSKRKRWEKESIKL